MSCKIFYMNKDKVTHFLIYIPSIGMYLNSDSETKRVYAKSFEFASPIDFDNIDLLADHLGYKKLLKEENLEYTWYEDDTKMKYLLKVRMHDASKQVMGRLAAKLTTDKTGRMLALKMAVISNGIKICE